MAQNLLTAEQDVLTRRFFLEVAETAETALPGAPVFARQLRAICLLLLNYDQLTSGAFITKGTVVQAEFGSKDLSAYPDEWAADFEAALAVIAQGDTNEASDNTDRRQASPSEPSTDTTVRETLFPKDV